MSDDWAVGDLALCVDVSPPRRCKRPEGRALAAALVLGRAYRVVEIRTITRGVDAGYIALRFPGFDYRTEGGEYAGFDKARFRKIRPDAHEGSADDWALILETTKRKAKA